MTVEVRPLGVKCNLKCVYCYQNEQRKENLTSYSMKLMKETIKVKDTSFTLFGGECLLLPLEDLEELLAWGFVRWGHSSIQTNGTLINEKHIEIFKLYNVRVGISIDGPGAMNDARWAGSLEKTRIATQKSENSIKLLCQEGIPTSIIVTLHRGNATAAKLPTMHKWICSLDSMGINSMRLHILEVDNEKTFHTYALSAKENINAFMSFMALESVLKKIRFDVFADIRKMLLGKDNNTTCIWNACDPYTTRAVQGIEGNGQFSNCGRVDKDGINYLKSEKEGFERYIALYYTPYEHGGCQGCRFFLMCKGQCPGTAISGDWRNRTEHCEVWYKLFQFLEDKLIREGCSPISADRALCKFLEKEFLRAWANGQNQMMSSIIASR